METAKLTTKEYARTKSGDVTVDEAYILPCGRQPTARVRAAHAWSFNSADYVLQAVLAYESPGTAVIDELRGELADCREWSSSGGALALENAGEFPIDQPAGVDNSMAYCHRLTFRSGPTKGDTIVICEIFMSRGHLVGMVGTYDKRASASQDKISKVAPALAAALVRALPTP